MSDIERHRDEVFTTLRRLIVSGHFKPRQQLKPRDIGRDLDVTPTPVREALMRLTGERLVARSAGGRGFFIPYASVTELSDLYRWRFTLLSAALHAAEGAIEVRISGRDYPERVGGLFRRIEAQSVAEHRLAGISADERLHLMRYSEADALPHVDRELEQLADILNGASRARSLAALRAFHQRRIAAVKAIRSGALYKALGDNGD